eukprot:11226981-Lingulodinium_polyedra.AAC.1
MPPATPAAKIGNEFLARLYGLLDFTRARGAVKRYTRVSVKVYYLAMVRRNGHGACRFPIPGL